ncbi:hypothetical protein GCM10011506_41860 [Marivirga lumbricoides]|uniref:tRNA/rRNA methyltransferase SpoU type domain-containing protein n=1 Tax=Marivirga lumbricoides TaxID=1046115 RepID=A0ABQ1N240_9BACT|nr:hypothetical protein GCM10011506_41860 [Marivirga lumbricoides]
MKRVQKQHQEVENSKHQQAIVIVAENIRTPENVGMIMRVAEAFGVERLFFTGTLGVGLTTKVKRASRNTYQKIPFFFEEDSRGIMNELQEAGYKALALEITKNSRAIQTFNFRKEDKIAIVIGSERNGISEALLSIIPESVHIPLYGQNSSINVVTALAIALQEIVR